MIEFVIRPFTIFLQGRKIVSIIEVEANCTAYLYMCLHSI